MFRPTSSWACWVPPTRICAHSSAFWPPTSTCAATRSTLSGEPADVALAERVISELMAIVDSGQPLTPEVVRHSVGDADRHGRRVARRGADARHPARGAARRFGQRR